MRKLMWFTIGVAVSCGLCAYQLNQRRILPLMILSLILFLLGAVFGRERRNLLRAAAVFLGCSLGFAWFMGYDGFYFSPVTGLDGREVPVQITASDFSYDTGYGTGVEGIITIEDKPYQIRVYLKENMELCPGDAVNGLFRLRLTTPDGEKTSTYFQGKGIFLMAYQKEDVQITRSETLPKWCFPAVLRHQLREMLDSMFPEDTAPFAKALLLGYSSELDYETETAFKVSGIRHIIAVSGLHISILYGLVCVLTLRRRYLTAIVGLPVLLLFAAVAGFTPSVTRACIMVSLMMLAMVFDREYDPATALAFAVLVMLIINPLAITSVSLQLSVGCVAGILLFNGSINSWLKSLFPIEKGRKAKLREFLCSSVSVTVSAMSLITPLSAFYFGAVSLVGVLTNLLTLWVVTFVFNGLAALCLLYPLLPGLGAILAEILSWPIRYVLFIAKSLASFPLAAVYTKSIYIVLWLIFVYALLAAFLLTKKKQPAVLLCCMLLSLCLALLASWGEPLTADTRITMLDVGQGQAILLQSTGKTFLVDCGGDDDGKTADIIAETLLSQGVQRLDGIIVTHYDRDHAGALHNLLTRIDTDHLFLPDTQNDMPMPQTQGEIIYVWEPLELTFGIASLRIFGPVYSGSDNENSLCVLFDTEKCDILITGDRSAFGERMLLRKNTLPDVDILVAGHHGAADSTSVELLQAVSPETVLISAEKDNIYGHPAPALLQRLEDFGCSIYRTDLHGTIIIRR